jgi:hypothetical protein
VALSLGVGGGPVVHLSGVFGKMVEKIFGIWKKIFSFEERRPRPRRGGQDPGWLSGKINELKWVQPVFCYLDDFGGCTHRYSNILAASPRIIELLLLKDCWMKYLSTDEYM